MGFFSVIVFLLIGYVFKILIDPILTMGGNISPLHNFFYFLAIVSLIDNLIKYFKKNSKENKLESYYCENCQEELQKDKIKFGTCPKCGQKIKDFTGEQHIHLK